MSGQESQSASRPALDQLFSEAYEQLRRMASSVRRNDPAITLNPTALVHEAWLKLARNSGFTIGSPLHFKRIAARAMRQVLIESARRRQSGKRGGDQNFVTLVDEAGETPLDPAEMLTLDSSLTELERIQPRQASIVESRFFGGLEITEIAACLDVSEATVHREWRVAKAWLKVRLQQARS